MSRNIVICCDGTNNEFGICNTNVVRLAEIFVNDAVQQTVYYHPGVGTLPDPRTRTRWEQKLSRWKALAFGSDLEDKVKSAYARLMEVYQPDDRVFLFGFSRGADTARVLAGMLHAIGLLPAGNTQLIPYGMRLFSGTRHAKDDKYWRVLNNFRATFARLVRGNGGNHFPVHFLGLWDTASSVGLVWNPKSYPFTKDNPSVGTVRHAVSLDERRCAFRQNLFTAEPNQDVTARWFPGVHSDVGGGYPEEDGGLWRAAFEWIIDEAAKAKVLVDSAQLAKLRGRSPVPARIWAERQHESLEGWWWVAEVVPKKQFNPATKTKAWEFGCGRARMVHLGDVLDTTVLERIRGKPDYKPTNLSSDFIRRVKEMPSVNGPLPYAP
jgi:uncharacterized protein (DUF2235 family)